MAEKQKWFCTDCDDIFTDETGERCPSCGFRRVIGPFQYANRHDIKEALHAGALVVPNGERG